MPAIAKPLVAVKAVARFVILIALVAVIEAGIHWFLFGTVHEDDALQDQVITALDSFNPLELASTYALILYNQKLPPEQTPYYKRCLRDSPELWYAGCRKKAAELWPSAPYQVNGTARIPTALWRTAVYDQATSNPAERLILLAQLVVGAVLTWALFSWTRTSEPITAAPVTTWLLMPAFYTAGILFFATVTAFPLAYIAKLTLKPLWALYTVVSANLIHSFAHLTLGEHAGAA